MGDITTLSSLARAIRASEQDSAESYLILKAMHPGYLGSATIVTRPNYSAAVPSRSTLSSIAATADSFIVKAWNGNGCWTWRVRSPPRRSIVAGAEHRDWPVKTGRATTDTWRGSSILWGLLGDWQSFSLTIGGSGSVLAADAQHMMALDLLT